MMNRQSILKRIVKWSPFPALVLLIVFVIISVTNTNDFFGGFLIGFFDANIPLVCVAIGVAVVLIGGGIDISLGSIVCLVNVVIVTLYGLGASLIIAIIGGVVVGTLAGAINGIVVAYLRITPLLTTFATSSVFLGLALWILPSPGGMVPIDFVMWYIGNVGGIPTAIVFLIVGLALWIVIKKSKFGVWLYAVGHDDMKSYVSAVPVERVKLSTYAFAGFMSALGAVALTANVGAGDPLVGTTFSMMAIASCVIGGISLSGGIGDVIGAVFGALFLGLVTNTVLSAVSDPFFQNFYSGLIMLIGVIGSVMVNSLIKKIA